MTWSGGGGGRHSDLVRGGGGRHSDLVPGGGRRCDLVHGHPPPPPLPPNLDRQMPVKT